MSSTTEKGGLIDSACSFYRFTLLGQVEGIKSKLDPISVLAVIALLKYKECLTLLGFKGYQITTEPPSDYEYGVNIQGVVRRLFCEGREDLDIIPVAISKGADWFHPEIEGNAAHRELFNAALDGLTSLQESYQQKKSGVTVSAITEWQKMIRAKIEIIEVDEEQNDASELDATTQKVKALWSLAEIREVNSLLSQMKERQGDVSPNEEIKCPDQIARLEFLLSQKGENLKAIYEK